MKKSYLPTLVLINGKSPQFLGGGYQTHTANMARIFTELGYKVNIFCFGKKNSVEQSPIGTIYSIKSFIYDLPFLKSIEIAGIGILAPLLAFRILQYLKFATPVILFGIGPWSMAAALIKLCTFGKKRIFISYYPTTFRHEFRGTLSATKISDHGLWNKMQVLAAYVTLIPIYSLLEKFFLTLSDKIVNHYASAETILKDQFAIPPNKLVRIPYYIELVKRLGKDSIEDISHISKPIILLICRHDGRKGINFLLHAFSLLNKRKIRYSAVLVGSGKLFNAHKKLAEKLSLFNVHLVGFLSNPTQLFKKADMYVFPSVEEGSSAISILEAMKQGLPIVSTNVDGIVEDIEHEKSALLVEPYSSLALANAIQRVLENKHLAKQIGDNAKKRYQEKYDKKKVKEEIDAFLKKVIFEYKLLDQ